MGEENHNPTTTRSPQTNPHHQNWGTLEELLLAYAVKRHGSNDWDAVAMEIQTRTTLIVTAHNCRQKFLDLNRRFSTAPDDDVDHVPWLDQLRKLRVAELQASLQRSDVSILSLQLKVKKLEEERGKGLKDNAGDDEEKPDLAGSGDLKAQNDKKTGPEKNPEPASVEPETHRLDEDHNVKQPASDESDRENQSVNESNSTVSVGKTGEGEVKLEPNPVQAGPNEPDAAERKANPIGEESNNGSYDAAAKTAAGDSLPASEERKVGESSEMRDSVTHSREGGGGGGGGEGGTRESSEVQSSASLTRRRKPRRRKEAEELPENDEKVRPLIAVLDLIKGHDHSSLFERRLDTQEVEKYKKVVRQQIDYETIQRRLRNGTYSRSTHAFFRDLLLLFTNAAAFFPKDSSESCAAHHLGHLVSAEIPHHIPVTPPTRNHPDSLPPNPTSSSKPNHPDSLLSKHKASAPIMVCRKRSAFSAKPSTSSATFGQKGDLVHDKKKPTASDTKPPPLKPSSSATDDDETPKNNKEKPITRVRSLRRSNKNLAASKKAGTTSKPPEPPKSDKSKTEGSAGTDKKRSAAADFLKRIKRSAPAEAFRNSVSGGGGSSSKGGGSSSKGGGSSGGKDQKKIISGGKGKEKASKQAAATAGGGSSSSGDKKNENENSSQSKRSVGRPPKKVAEASNVSAKRGRENGGKDKRPKKRKR